MNIFVVQLTQDQIILIIDLATDRLREIIPPDNDNDELIQALDDLVSSLVDQGCAAVIEQANEPEPDEFV